MLPSLKPSEIQIQGSANPFKMESAVLVSDKPLNPAIFDDLKQGVGRTRQIELGDSHGTIFKALHAAICAGWVSFSDEASESGLASNEKIIADYNEFVRLCAIPPDLIDLSENGEYDQLVTLISRLTQGTSYPNPEEQTALSLLIDGDLRGDRGLNDLYTKLTKSYLRKNLKIKTPEIASNHWFQAVCPDEKTITDEDKFISALNERVLVKRLIEAKKITQKEFDALNDEDLETIQLIAYKIDIDDSNGQIIDIQLTSHAPEGTGPISIDILAKYFGILKRDESIDSAFQLRQTIDAINAAFTEKITTKETQIEFFKEIAENYKNGFSIWETHGEDELEILKSRREENPFYAPLFSVESVKYSDIQWEPLKIDGIIPSQSFGHIGQDIKQYHPKMYNMDGNAGNSRVIDKISESNTKFDIYVIPETSDENNQTQYTQTVEAQKALQSSCMIFKFTSTPSEAIEYTILIKNKAPIVGTILPAYDFLYDKLKKYNSITDSYDQRKLKGSILTFTALRHRLDPSLCQQIVKTKTKALDGSIVETDPLNPLFISSCYDSIVSLKLFFKSQLTNLQGKISEDIYNIFGVWCDPQHYEKTAEFNELVKVMSEQKLEEYLYETFSYTLTHLSDNEFSSTNASLEKLSSKENIAKNKLLIQTHKAYQHKKNHVRKIDSLISASPVSFGFTSLKAYLLKNNNWTIYGIDMTIAFQRAEKEQLENPTSTILNNFLQYIEKIISQGMRVSAQVDLKRLEISAHNDTFLTTFNNFFDFESTKLIKILQDILDSVNTNDSKFTTLSSDENLRDLFSQWPLWSDNKSLNSSDKIFQLLDEIIFKNANRSKLTPLLLNEKMQDSAMVYCLANLQKLNKNSLHAYLVAQLLPFLDYIYANATQHSELTPTLILINDIVKNLSNAENNSAFYQNAIIISKILLQFIQSDISLQKKLSILKTLNNKSLMSGEAKKIENPLKLFNELDEKKAILRDPPPSIEKCFSERFNVLFDDSISLKGSSNNLFTALTKINNLADATSTENKRYFPKIKPEDFDWLFTNYDNLAKLLQDNTKDNSELATPYLQIIKNITETLEKYSRDDHRARKARRMNKVLSTLDLSTTEGIEIFKSFEQWYLPKNIDSKKITREQLERALEMDNAIFNRIKGIDPAIYISTDKPNYPITMRKWTASLGKLAELQVAILQPLKGEKTDPEAEPPQKNLISKDDVHNLFSSMNKAAELALTCDKKATEVLTITDQITELSIEYYKTPFEKKETKEEKDTAFCSATAGIINDLENKSLADKRSFSETFSLARIWQRIRHYFSKLEVNLKDDQQELKNAAEKKYDTRSARLVQKTALGITLGLIQVPKKRNSHSPLTKEFAGPVRM